MHFNAKALSVASPHPKRRFITKTLLIMKLTSLLVLAACLQVSARTYSQTVSFSERNAPLEKVFGIIERQTGYTFYYKVELLRQARAVYATCNNMELEQALQVIFKDQPLAYNIVDRNIVVSEKKMPVEKIAGIASPAAPPVLRGRILDSLGNPVAGASIVIKGGSRTFMSADDGSFEIKNIDPQSVLVISSVGYRSTEIAVSGRTYISIQLHQQPDKLSELTVVSTGYQRIKQYQMTGAVAVLSEKDYDQRVAVSGNFLESLEGKIPGLVYNSQSGELSIRGVATFSAVKQPLIIVDGFPTEINLLTINPNDIISINVLRDAAASAIYGVRASNGVIVVETRRGKSGKAQFNLRATTALQPKPDFSYLKYAPANEYAQLESAMITSANQGSLLNYYATSGYPLTPVQTIMVNKYLGTITADQVAQQVAAVGAYDNLAEYERLFYQQRLTSNLNLDVSGGSERASYMLGFNYVGDRLVNRRSTNRQYNVNLANTIQLNSRMRFDFKGVYTNGTNVSGNTPAYASFYPYEHLADSAGNALPVSMGVLSGSSRSNSINAVSPANNAINMAAGLYDGRYYPYRELTSNTNTNRYSSIRLQGRLNVIITPWMNMDIGGNYENQQSTLDNLQKEDAFNTRMLLNLSALKDASSGKAQFTNIPQGDILKRTSQKLINYTVRAQLNLNKRFGTDHALSGILGVEQRKLSTDAFTTSYFGYDGQTLLNKPINMVAMNNLGISNSAFPNVGTIIGVGTAAATYFNQANKDSRFMSYYGDGTYTFKDKYIATGSLRLDQSNLFGSDPKYRNKPLWSAGLAWRMVKEDFMQSLTWLNDLKLRVATGFTGNIPSSNNGKFLLLTAGVTTLFPTAQTYYTVSSPENESLRWETTKNYNFGLDYALFGSRVFGTVDYYIKKSVDVFGTFGADPTSGFNSYNANTASIINRGLELMITSANIKSRHIRWTTTVTASFNHNEVLTVKSTAYSASYSYVTATQNVQGKPLGALFSYNYGGLTALGQPFVLDAKGNSKIINGTSIDVLQSDLLYNGTTTPKYALGLNNQLSVGDIDFSFLFMYYGGHVMRVEAPSPNSTFNPNPIEGSSNYWKKPGDEKSTLIPALPLGSSLATGYYSAFAAYTYYYANQFVRKADYIRLRDVVVTWNIRGAALQKMGLQQPQLRLQAQNAFRYTFSGNDIDPEAIDRIGGHRYLPQQPMYSLSFYCKF